MNKMDLARAIVIALGGALISLGKAWGPIAGHFPWLNGWDSVLLYAGIVLILAGLFIFFSSAVRYLIRALRDSLRGILPLRNRIVCIPASLADLPAIRSMYTNSFGDDVASIALMQNWIERNPDVIWKLVEEKGKLTCLIGSFKLIPLNKSGVERLEQGLVSGTTLAPADIVKRGGRPAGFYLGNVVGIRAVGRYEVMRQIDEKLRTATNRTIYVYARALTKDGLRLIKKYQFEPIAHRDEEPKLREMCRSMPSRWRANQLRPSRN